MAGEQGREGVLLVPDKWANDDLPQINGRRSAWRFVWHAKEYASNAKKKPASIDYLLLFMKLLFKMK